MAISKKPYIQTYFISLLILLSLTACSSEKFLGQNEYRLSSVKISSDTSSVNASSYTLYVRQLPNSKWFNLFKVPLALYSLSGTDTTKSINRFWRRIGEAPVIFDEQQMVNTQNSIVFALKDKGYLNARVTTIKTTEHHNKRIKLNYKKYSSHCR